MESVEAVTGGLKGVSLRPYRVDLHPIKHPIRALDEDGLAARNALERFGKERDEQVRYWMM